MDHIKRKFLYLKISKLILKIIFLGSIYIIEMSYKIVNYKFNIINDLRYIFKDQKEKMKNDLVFDLEKKIFANQIFKYNNIDP